jgi:hypothetical protein
MLPSESPPGKERLAAFASGRDPLPHVRRCLGYGAIASQGGAARGDLMSFIPLQVSFGTAMGAVTFHFRKGKEAEDSCKYDALELLLLLE